MCIKACLKKFNKKSIIVGTIVIIVGFILIGKHFMNKHDGKSIKSVESTTGVLNIEHWMSTKGTPVYFVQAMNLPMVDIQVTFDAGSARDANQSGVASLTNAMLKEGTSTLTADAVAEQFEEVGAEFGAGVSNDMAIVNLRSLTEPDSLIPAVETLTQIISKPAFAEAGFKREQAQALLGLKYAAQQPDKIAQKVFYAKLYPNQPYGNWTDGREEVITKLTPADLSAFYKQYYVAKNAVITLVGALSLSEANQIAEKISQSLDVGKRAPSLPPVKDLANLTKATAKNFVEKVVFPSAQTHIMMGAPGMKRDDPDFFALTLGNHILGGNSTVTRIFEEIRHKRGLAYDVHSYFVPMRERGPFVVGLQTKTEQADEALKILQSTVKEFITKGPTKKELEDAKLNILGGYALRFDNNRAIVANVSMLGFYNLPLNYFDTYKKNVEKVSTSSIKKAFEQRVHPDNMVVVMVGR